MVQFDDAKKAYLLTQLSKTSGNLLDLEKEFYLSELSLTSGNTIDLEKAWVKSQGFNGWQSFLFSEGYSGSVRDMQLQYYIDNS